MCSSDLDGTRLTITGATGGAGMPVTVVTKLSTTSHSVVITPASVLLFGREVPVSALSALPGGSGLAGRLKPRTIDIPDLPRGTALVGAHAESTGLVLDFKVAPTGAEQAVGTASAASRCASGRGQADS